MTYSAWSSSSSSSSFPSLLVFKPWPGSLQSLPPCQKELFSSWPHHQPFSWLPPLLFSDAPPVRWKKLEWRHSSYEDLKKNTRCFLNTTSHMTCVHPQWNTVMLPRRQDEKLGFFCHCRSFTAILFCLSFSFSARTLWISALSARRRSWRISPRDWKTVKKSLDYKPQCSESTD